MTRKICKLLVLGTLALFISTVVSAWLCASASAAPVLESVFDGKDLNGWGQKPSGSFIFNATDKCIETSGSARGFCYTATKYSRYRVIYSVRQLVHLHNPTVLFFGFNTNLDAMGGIQFQLPYDNAWDYRPGKNNSPPSSIWTTFGSLPGKQPTNVWYRCEMLVDQTKGTSDSAAELLSGGSAVHIMEFHDSTVTNVPCPFAIQVHQSKIFDEYKDILIETNPPFTGLVLVSLPAPSGLQATASGTQVNLSWTINSTTQTGFEVFHSTDDQNWTLVATTGATATSYSDTGLSGNTTYFYRVAAITSDAISDYATASATTGSGGPNPDFSISATPPSQTVTPGGSTNFMVIVSPTNGFTGTVTFSVSGLPTGTSASFSPNAVTGSGTSTMTVTTSTSTPPGTYPLTITGTSGSLVHSTTVDLIVTAAPDFSLTASPSSLTITQGSNGTSTITVSAINGYTNSVSLSASGLPSGVTASFNPSSTASTSTLTLTASSNATTGTATVTISGTDGTLTHSTPISLTVNPVRTLMGVFQIQNEASGLVLNNQGSLTNGSPITQWNSVSSSNLDWTFIATSNGYYQINSFKSGRDAVVQSASTVDGAKIIQWSFGSSGDDQWKPVPNSDGSYTFFNLHSGLVLEDPGSSTNKTTQMDQWSSTGASNQKWNLLAQ